MKIRRGDKVKILLGKDRGKVGQLQRVYQREGKVVVEGVNLYKKHLRPSGKQKGGVVALERPLPVSRVALICPQCGKPTRVGFKMAAGKKTRLCRLCLQEIV